MEIMYDKKNHRTIEVYSFDIDHNTALIYDSSIRAKGAGTGWVKIPMKNILPLSYVDLPSGEYCSKTEQARIKHELALVDAIWECTDGERYTHADLQKAMSHQRDLMKQSEEAKENAYAPEA